MAYSTINDPSAYFQIKTWSGNGVDDRNLTNDGNSNLQPDFLWNKRTNTTGSHQLHDSSRGVLEALHSNDSNAQGTESNAVQAFQTDGFQVGNDANINGSGKDYIAWQWKANGGTTSSDGNGSITSTVQASTTAGFSIVTYTGTGSNATVGHGLGVTPEVIFVKLTSGSGDWVSFHQPLGNTKFLRLNSDIAAGTQSTYWQDTSPTTTAFSIGTAGDVNTSSGSHVAYCFKSIKGYSKFGSYKGNGNSDGTFVYTGFAVSYLMMKRTDSAGEWLIYDNKRNITNLRDTRLEAQDNFANSTGSSKSFDFCGNGFKCRGDDSDMNGSGNDYIYLAFADNTLVGTNNIISLAR